MLRLHFFELSALGILWLATVGHLYEICGKDCEGPKCPEKQECYSGHCNDKGHCICDPCWSGRDCREYDNRFEPVFNLTTMTVTVPHDQGPKEPLFTVEAVDNDKTFSCQGNAVTIQHCPCAKMLYQIEFGNDDSTFTINSETGDVFLSRGAKLNPYQEYFVTIVVRNPTVTGINYTDLPTQETSFRSRMNVIMYVRKFGYESSDVAEAIPVKLDEGEWQGYPAEFSRNLMDEEGDVLHSRLKRDISPNVSIPDNVTFYLEKVGTDQTEMYVGSSVLFRLGIHFPFGTTDMRVELFSIDNDTTAMQLCNPKITYTGSNLQYNQSSANPVLTSYNSGTVNDWAVIDLGDVINDASDSDHFNHSMLYIEFEIVMFTNNVTENGSQYWVSAGAAYKNEDFVWVGQAALTTLEDEFNITEEPTFNMTGPLTMEIGSSAIFQVDMYLQNPSADLVFNAFAPFNTSSPISVMSVCSVSLKDSGLNYACLDKDGFAKKELDFPYADGSEGSSRKQLSFGTVLNKGSRNAIYVHENSRLTVQFMVHLFNDVSYLNQEYWVGATLEIGSDEIWAGQVKVTAVERTEKNETSVPNVTPSISKSTVKTGEGLVISLDIELPENVENNYVLKAFTPFEDGSARARICKASITYTGYNLGCPVTATPNFTAEDGGYDYNRVSMDMGPLLNSGFASTSIDAEASKIKIELIMQVLNHSSNYDGGNISISLGLETGSSILWVGEYTIDIVETGSNVTNETAPEFKLSFGLDNKDIHIDEVSEVLLTMTTKPGVDLTGGVDAEFILPFENSSAVFSVCSATLFSVGKNIPCLNKEAFQFTLKSSGDPNKNDKAALSLGPVCNMGELGNAPTEADDAIVFKLTFKVENHANLSDGDKRWVSGGIQYDPSRLWVGQLAVYVQEGLTLELNQSIAGLPHVDVRYADVNENQLAPGAAETFTIVLKTPPRTSAHYSVEVTSDTTISLCGMFLVRIGESAGCYDTNRKSTSYRHASRPTNGRIVIDLGIITNTGDTNMTASSDFDNNTVEIQLTLQLSDNTTLVADQSSHNFMINVTVGTATFITQGGTIVANYTIGQLIGSPSPSNTNVSMSLFEHGSASLNGDGVIQLVKGEAAVFKLTISLPDYGYGRVLVKFLTPLNATQSMEICDVSVISIGANYPCISAAASYSDFYIPTYEKRSSSPYIDIGSLDIGSVCQTPKERSDEANTIEIQGIAKFVRDTDLNDGDQYYVGATVKINDDTIFTNLLVVEYKAEFNQTPSENVDFIAISSSNNTIVVRNNDSVSNNSVYLDVADVFMEVGVGSFYDIPLVVTVPTGTHRIVLDAEMVVNDTVVTTIHDISVKSAGANLACLQHDSEEVKFVSSQTLGNSQADQGYLDLNVVTNTDLTNRLNKYTASDDKFVVNFNLQVTDNIYNEHDSIHKFSVGARVGNAVYVIDKLIQIKRTNQERPIIEAKVSVDNETIYSKTKEVMFECSLQHNASSTAEGYNVSVHLYLPPYMTFYAIESNLQSSFNDTVADGVLVVTFKRLLFSDVVQFNVTAKINADLLFLYEAQEADVEILYDVTYNMVYRANNVNPEGTEFRSDMEMLPVIKINPEGWPGCEDALGMATKDIQDCQITGSPGDTPAKGRYGQSPYWTVFSRSAEYMDYRYMDIHFSNITRVTAILLQRANGGRVQNFSISTSRDGVAWNMLEYLEPTPSYGTETVKLTKPKETSHIRIGFIPDDAQYASLSKNYGTRWEIKGCVTGELEEYDELCPTDNTLADKFDRGFLAAGDLMIFCDAAAQEDFPTACYLRNETEKSWRVIDDLESIFAYDPEDGMYYGIAKNGLAFMSSEDGILWRSIFLSKKDELKTKPGVVLAKNVEWTNTGTMLVAYTSPVFQLQMMPYGATFHGLYWHTGSLWQQIVRWA